MNFQSGINFDPIYRAGSMAIFRQRRIFLARS